MQTPYLYKYGQQDLTGANDIYLHANKNKTINTTGSNLEIRRPTQAWPVIWLEVTKSLPRSLASAAPRGELRRGSFPWTRDKFTRQKPRTSNVLSALKIKTLSSTWAQQVSIGPTGVREAATNRSFPAGRFTKKGRQISGLGCKGMGHDMYLYTHSGKHTRKHADRSPTFRCTHEHQDTVSKATIIVNGYSVSTRHVKLLCMATTTVCPSTKPSSIIAYH